jgi:hypothetical protein
MAKRWFQFVFGRRVDYIVSANGAVASTVGGPSMLLSHFHRLNQTPWG